jgi:hypothetical protein
MYATLLTALAVLIQPPAQPVPPQPGQFVPGQPGVNQPGMPATTSLDGTWTVLTLEKNGDVVKDMANKTITVKNGIATFTNGNDKREQMRLEFGPNGTLRVTDLSNNTDQTNTPPPGAIPGGVAQYSPQQMKTGVYIMTNNYFSVTLHNNQPPPPPPGAPGFANAPRQSKAYMTLFLKRTGNSNNTNNNNNNRSGEER